MWSDADIAGFLQAFGRSAVLDDRSLAGQTITGIYRSPFSSVSPGEIGVESSQPTLTVATAEVDTDFVRHGSGVYIPGAGIDEFVIIGIQPDGTGWTTLVLQQREF